MSITVTNTPPPAVAKAVQIEIWLDQNGFPGGFENASIVAAAAAAGSEAQIRLRRGGDFDSDDPFLVAAAPTLGIADLRAAIEAAALL